MAKRKKVARKRKRTSLPLKHSFAIRQFLSNIADYDRLMAVHEAITGTGAGRRYGVEVLNKSAILVIYATWEAYLEDVLSELILGILRRVETPAAIPDSLKTYITKQLDATKHDFAMWALAGTSWRKHLIAFISGVTEKRNFHFNSATAEQIDKLFKDCVGVDILNAWHWQGMSTKQACTKLKALVRLRGALAHRSVAIVPVTKATVDTYARFIKKLVTKTDEQIVNMLNANTFGLSTPVNLANLVSKSSG